MRVQETVDGSAEGQRCISQVLPVKMFGDDKFSTYSDPIVVVFSNWRGILVLSTQ